ARPSVTLGVRADEIAFRLGRPRFEPPPLALRDLAIDATLRDGELSFEARTKARSGTATLAAEGTLALGDPSRHRFRARAESVSAAMVTKIAAAFVVLPEPALALPPDLRADLTIEGDGAPRTANAANTAQTANSANTANTADT